MATTSFSASLGCKTLIIHIGDHKTGSTSIQHAFAKGCVHIPGQRICYPTRLSHNHLRGPAKALGPNSPAPKRAEAELAFTRIAERIAHSGADIALISAEEFDNVPPMRLREIIDRFFAPIAKEIRVVAYVRPHAPRLVSSFATQTKSGMFNDGTLADFHNKFLEEKRLLYHPRFSALRAAFGKNFVLRPMIRNHLVNGDVVADFLQHGIGSQNFEIAPFPTANESLYLEDLMRLKVLQSRHQHLRWKLRHALGWEFTRILAQMPPPAPAKLSLHRNLARQVHADYVTDARAMDRDFFNGAPLLESELEIACDKSLESAQSVEPTDHFSASEMRSLELLSELVAGLMAHPQANWTKVLRERRINTLEEYEDGD